MSGADKDAIIGPFLAQRGTSSIVTGGGSKFSGHIMCKRSKPWIDKGINFFFLAAHRSWSIKCNKVRTMSSGSKLQYQRTHPRTDVLFILVNKILRGSEKKCRNVQMCHNILIQFRN